MNSLDKKLKRKGWKVVDCIRDEELPVKLCKIALEIARGNYDTVKLIPSDIAREGEEWIPKYPSHILYASGSKSLKKELDERGVYFYLSTLCVHQQTGELRKMPINLI
ncbi:hypothetical protein KAT80_01960 [Candidatus Pacearchaeota archaeon]|nr:hypothetical protein [Candidatus Pacearchaeota archaeon]